MRDSMFCARCRKPLTQSQGVYCSRACMRVPDRACATCRQPFHPRRRTKRYCSPECVPNHGPQPLRQLEVLALLRATTWMTTIDLARAVYGDNTWDDCQAVRLVFYRLRQAGHVIESRLLKRVGQYGRAPLEYRLAEDVHRQEAVA